MAHKKWTEQELILAKKLYLEGKPLKIIAESLERTHTSLNKVLSRYKIRNLRIPANMNRLESPIEQTNLVDSFQFDKFFEHNNAQWVSQKKLERMFFKVFSSCHRIGNTAVRAYKLGSESLTFGQMLYRLNKKREISGPDQLVQFEYNRVKNTLQLMHSFMVYINNTKYK